MFGGGKDNARKALKKSAELFETYKPESSLYPDWGHEGPYIWLGRIALEQDSLDLAEQYFDQALQINPDHGQVKHQLLPQLQKKRQEQSAAKNKTSE
ncbi:MAG: tetratricopeptide repeat protein [Aliifodinibius sp.]|nr:tetratricopeptide repeat protein [Fodinibius sp.]